MHRRPPIHSGAPPKYTALRVLAFDCMMRRHASSSGKPRWHPFWNSASDAGSIRFSRKVINHLHRSRAPTPIRVTEDRVVLRQDAQELPDRWAAPSIESALPAIHSAASRRRRWLTRGTSTTNIGLVFELC